MKNNDVVSFPLDKSDSYPRPGESDVEFMARIKKRRDERRGRMSQDELARIGNSSASLEAAAKELGYL